jgi:hypothetical protein
MCISEQLASYSFELTLFLKLLMLTWAILRTFLGCLLVFIALLGSLAEVDILMLFMLVEGELHTVDFLLGHTASVLTAYIWFIGTCLLHTITVGSAEPFRAVRGTSIMLLTLCLPMPLV